MLNAVQQNSLDEIARYAYGSGFFEKTSGGRGHMGVLNGPDGPRVIKFDTHGSDSKASELVKAQMRNSCNELREQLLRLAENSGVDAKTLASIRSKLGLKDGMRTSDCTSLLKRKVVASVVKLIDRESFTRVVNGIGTNNIGQYSSRNTAAMHFSDVKEMKTNEKLQGVRINDTAFESLLDRETGAELRDFLACFGNQISGKDRLSITECVNTAVAHRKNYVKVNADANACRNLVKTIVARVLTARGKPELARAYLGNNGTGESVYDEGLFDLHAARFAALREEEASDDGKVGLLDAVLKEFCRSAWVTTSLTASAPKENVISDVMLDPIVEAGRTALERKNEERQQKINSAFGDSKAVKFFKGETKRLFFSALDLLDVSTHDSRRHISNNQIFLTAFMARGFQTAAANGVKEFDRTSLWRTVYDEEPPADVENLSNEEFNRAFGNRSEAKLGELVGVENIGDNVVALDGGVSLDGLIGKNDPEHIYTLKDFLIPPKFGNGEETRPEDIAGSKRSMGKLFGRELNQYVEGRGQKRAIEFNGKQIFKLENFNAKCEEWKQINSNDNFFEAGVTVFEQEFEDFKKLTGANDLQSMAVFSTLYSGAWGVFGGMGFLTDRPSEITTKVEKSGEDIVIRSNFRPGDAVEGAPANNRRGYIEVVIKPDGTQEVTDLRSVVAE